MSVTTKTIGIYIFDDVEVLDFAGPFEVMTTATRVHQRDDPQAPPLFSVVTLGQATSPVRARAGLKIEPDFPISNHPNLDCLIVPGGVVTRQIENDHVIDWIALQIKSVPLVASVCTGAFLLAKAGALNGMDATTHWEDIHDLETMFPDVRVHRGVRWVDAGRIVTSAGISAGVDMSLHLIERFAGRQAADRTARQMEFDWTGPGTREGQMWVQRQ